MASWDFVIVGSGFGGSVSALRLAEKGWNVLVLEKGRRWRKEDFPTSNWDVPNWMWKPKVGLRGFFEMSFFDHVTIVHGVGVGGGSLTYANTLPMPKDEFFTNGSWAPLADWKQELAQPYATAKKMLGAAENPSVTRGDRLMREIAREMGREAHFHPTEVAVYFGEPDVEVDDPYFGGEGPRRTGCNFCGACMTGCRVGAKNTLDRNYLHLAERRGVTVRDRTEVRAVRAKDGGGYAIEIGPSIGEGRDETLHADRVIFAGGVLGTVPLLLRMREDPRGLPRLSPRTGDLVRTNSEALIGVVSTNASEDFSKGVAITSILHTDDHSHVEPVRYGQGSGFFRMMMWPHAPGSNVLVRVGGAVRSLARSPVTWAKALTVPDLAKQSQILLYMRTLEGTMSFRLGRSFYTGLRRDLVSKLDPGTKGPSAFMKEATELAERWAAKVGGVPMTVFTETLSGVPTTAHILGGACMGATAEEGVVDARHRVHGYDGLYVIDGAAISANPGVNPSLSITALAERAMSFVPRKGDPWPDERGV